MVRHRIARKSAIAGVRQQILKNNSAMLINLINMALILPVVSAETRLECSLLQKREEVLLELRRPRQFGMKGGRDGFALLHNHDLVS